MAGQRLDADDTVKQCQRVEAKISFSDMDTGFCADVCFVTGTALIGANAVCFTVEDRFDDILDAAQVGGFDLDHMAGFMVGEVTDVFQGITPLIRNDFHIDVTTI